VASSTEFTAYSPSHLVVLAIFAGGTLALVAAGPRLRRSGAQRPLALTLAWGCVVFGLASSVLALFPFRVHHSLPLQICDFAWVVVAWALFGGAPGGRVAPSPLAAALTYYWGLTLSVQALVQPTLSQAFPDPNFFAFWGKHVLIVWGAVYLCLSLGHGPDWTSYRRAVAWTLGWLLAVFCLNAVLGSDYGYVNGKPSQATVLDVLGPWPGYVVAEMAIVLTLWALITLPWTGLPRRRSG
jgi:hypothetical integral membrane protein (TIGR02206 family)